MVGRRRGPYRARDFRRDLVRGAGLLLAGLLLATGFTARWWATASTPAGWRHTQGTVISVDHGPRGAEYVTIRLGDGGQEFHFRQSTPIWSLAATTYPHRGDRLPVVFDPGRPAEAKVEGWGDPTVEVVGWLSVAVVCYGIARLVAALYDLARERRRPPA
ncbi:Protein of unknown function (DUF3592) [Parafrankia irregularis]|uniref:DUF3592 domain-containing protein n=1 Tax=Parafrankia irregularis TaxID=795642 RepID=A0A0S4QE70_9ACTN|nr:MULTISPECIES: DUF3592 domain-containing protein [Parafrankia]MBE3199454.1 DUF3592 domain-containing protein [Parafrankia sp. CH37]CUU53883.1 Protein of unknown function (DUF3592) [Parafrankia irregularis]